MGNIFGGGRGGRHVRGRVYIMRLPPETIKIGCTARPVTVRLRELQSEYNAPDLYVLASFLVNDMGDGEDLAQRAVINDHQLQRIPGHDDWFHVPPGVTLSAIEATVRAALLNN